MDLATLISRGAGGELAKRLKFVEIFVEIDPVSTILSKRALHFREFRNHTGRKNATFCVFLVFMVFMVYGLYPTPRWKLASQNRSPRILEGAAGAKKEFLLHFFDLKKSRRCAAALRHPHTRGRTLGTIRRFPEISGDSRVLLGW